MLSAMGTAEFELQRTVPAPVDEVFARLADIEGHNDWMPGKRSIHKHSRQTSPGPTGVGTTYVDETAFGKAPGEVLEYDAPRRLVYHWRQTMLGRPTAEGWLGYTLEPATDGGTAVRHDARLQTYGLYRPATPMLRLIARRERTTTLEALVASFGTSVT